MPIVVPDLPSSNFKSFDIPTPYWRDAATSYCSPEPDINYDAYDLYILESRISQYMPTNSYLTFPGITRGLRREIVIRIYVPNEAPSIDIPFLSQKIEDITNSSWNEYASVLTIPTHIKNMKKSWILSVIPYISLNNFDWSKYRTAERLIGEQKEEENSHSDDFILQENQVLIKLERQSDFRRAAADIEDYIIKTLTHLYIRSTIVTSKEFAQRWDLKQINEEGLYGRTNPDDPRITQLIHDPLFKYPAPSLDIKHALAKVSPRPAYFLHNYYVATVSNRKEAEDLLHLVDNIVTIAGTKIEVLNFKTITDAEPYLRSDVDTAYYFTDNSARNITISYRI